MEHSAISLRGPEKCSPAQTAAVTAIPGVVFSASLSGHIRAYAAGTAKCCGTSTPNVISRR